jgi:23S rRNA C2498 (ribose-2'-O)-methylase RlmM
MEKPNKLEKFAFLPVPQEVQDAVCLIENWAKINNLRDDWAIGGICCRAGAERRRLAMQKIINTIMESEN